MKIFILLIFYSLAYLQVPYSIEFNSSSNLREVSSGLSSNAAFDIEILGDSTLIIGTDTGMNLAYYDQSGILRYGHFVGLNLVEGGNPALTIKDDIIAVSGVQSVDTSVGSQSKGMGISYSVDAGESWRYIAQPIDSSHQDFPTYENKWACLWGPFNENSLYNNKSECEFNCEDCDGNDGRCSMYDYISWGEQDSILNFAVTTDIQNVSYGLSIHGDYIYAASWAGSLRRFNYELQNPKWELVPLPMDNQDILNCNSINISEYQINPIGNSISTSNCGYEFDNHKVFSVFTVEDTLWVGTADGINKGIVNSDSCIDWTHFTAQDYGFYDDWIIGFENQILDNGVTNRLWAITWDRQYSGSHLIYGGPPSYTDDGGLTWHTPDELENRNLLTYNISSSPENIYVSSNQGLFTSSNYQADNLWDTFFLPDQISTQSVFDAELLENFNSLFIGTSQGICEYDGFNFECESVTGNIQDNLFYAYPNPLDFEVTNQLTFVFNNQEKNLNGNIVIYDLAMDRVAKIYSSEITRWDGTNDFGDKVANGLYIAKYKHSNGDSYLFNILVVNSK
tara:strand:+ start:1433 stop:3127 length:1695 start_codon:yes stop_codon:yes gene_type:complete